MDQDDLAEGARDRRVVAATTVLRSLQEEPDHLRGWFSLDSQSRVASHSNQRFRVTVVGADHLADRGGVKQGCAPL